MPLYLSSYGVSEEIETIVNSQCTKILQDAQSLVQRTPDARLPKQQYLLGTLTESVLNPKVQQLNVNFVRTMVTRFQCARDTSELGATIGDFIRYQIPTQLSVLVIPMETQSTRLRLALGPGAVGLPDPAYYIDPDQSDLKALDEYSKLLKLLGEDFSIPGLEQVIGMEKLSAPKLMESRKDSEILMRGAELQQLFPAIPWTTIFQNAIGSKEFQWKSQEILVLSKTWLQALNKWFRTVPIGLWKQWLSHNFLLYILPLLPPPYDNLEFELYGHKLKGQRQKTPQPRLALKLAQEWLTQSLGDVYVGRYVSSDLKMLATKLAKQVRAAAAERAGSTPWLAPETQQLAKRKTKAIHLGIAYPSSVPQEGMVKLNPERLVENVLTLAEADFKDELERVDTVLNVKVWDDPVFAVNAYYYNEGNRLILPAGILQWPFFHPKASDGWNYGGLGATIGHEISHAFDNDGKEYDEHGNKNPWWSKQESAEYQKKTKALVELYSKTKYFGHPLNGYLTLSENIADLGGVDIALTALKTVLKQRNASPETVKKELRDFFMSYAVSWRTKEKKAKAMQSLFMDVHAPPPARVNNIVCQFDEWYEAFDIIPGEALYKDPQHRIRIF
jgi:predicted metalloendopeptidase